MWSIRFEQIVPVIHGGRRCIGFWRLLTFIPIDHEDVGMVMSSKRHGLPLTSHLFTVWAATEATQAESRKSESTATSFEQSDTLAGGNTAVRTAFREHTQCSRCGCRIGEWIMMRNQKSIHRHATAECILVLRAISTNGEHLNCKDTTIFGQQY